MPAPWESLRTMCIKSILSIMEYGSTDISRMKKKGEIRTPGLYGSNFIFFPLDFSLMHDMKCLSRFFPYPRRILGKTHLINTGIPKRNKFRGNVRSALVNLKNEGDETTTETKLLVALSGERRTGSGIKLISQHAIPSLSPDETDNLVGEAVIILPVKGDNRIDISEIIKQILGIIPPSPGNDTTGDGDVDISDVLWGINYR